MYDRFTRASRIGRGKIPNQIRREVYSRDNYTCQFCGIKFCEDHLTIDHLIPLSLGGLDEATNYVTACQPCNTRKRDLPLQEFAKSVAIDVASLPIHGDPVLANEAIPLQIRLIRRRVFERIREGRMRATGKSAQKKIEKAYRLSLWESTIGKQLESEMPTLPGPVRAMVLEIRTIAKSMDEYLLMIELAKSANTRNLIGSVLTKDCDVMARIESLRLKSNDAALKKRLEYAIQRFQRELRKRGQQ
jgi:hypothetical protein